MSTAQAVTSDGVTLAVHDLGGSGTPALLVHATGFHGRVFAPLARHLWPYFHCYAVDLRGHGSSGVREDLDFDWRGFGFDVLAAVDRLGLESPVGFGHSCGGAALLLAEEARPGTFSSLYCFEPVVFPSEDAPRSDPSSSLASGARQRREVFASRREAYDNYASKPPLDVFEPSVLEAYVEFGFEDLPDGTVRLACRREHEALIYERGASHPAYSGLGDVACPTTLACGAKTDSFGPMVLELLAERLRNATVEVFDDLGHFGPLQRPAEVAAAVISAIDPPRA